MSQSQGEGATEAGLRVRTRVTVLLSARGGETVTPDHMTQSLQQMRAGGEGEVLKKKKKRIITSAQGKVNKEPREQQLWNKINR